MGLLSGQLKKLELTACSIEEGQVKINKSKTFSVMLNPSSVSLKQSISYNKQQSMGQLDSESKFQAYNSQTLSFEMLLDGTGAIVSNNDKNKNDEVKSQIDKINDIVYDYDGHKHEPNHVRVLWGSLIFFCRLDNMSTQYSLFKPDGDPLRAKLNMSFSGFMSKKEQSLTANRSSPDLTHVIQVKAGDTLPALCYQIYKDASYYIEIARLNHLTNFRVLQAGSTLHFPPLR